MKKILITDAYGFIGSHLTEMMIEKGYNVVAFDRFNLNADFQKKTINKIKKLVVIKKIVIFVRHNMNSIKISPSFFENMMSLIFKKI